MRAGSRRVVQIPLGMAGAVLFLLALAQLFLPGIAARRIRSRVARYGNVKSVSVNAWPAVKLLWGSAGSITVRAGDLSLTPAQVAGILEESGGAGRVAVTAESVRIDDVRVSDAVLHEHSGALTAEATMTEQDVEAALPNGVSVKLLDSSGGAVRVQVGGALFGFPAAVEAIAEAREGKLIAHPVGFLIDGLRVTLFAEPHLYIEGVGASVHPGSPPSYRLTAQAHLR